MAEQNQTIMSSPDQLAEETGALYSNDLADFLFSSLFGPGWENIVSSSQSSSYVTTLFSLFEIFNSTVLFGVGLLILWTVVAGVAGAAYEGKGAGGGGSNKVSLWTPARMAYAISLLAPLPGVGMSALQAIILALVMWSVQLANDNVKGAINVMTGSPVSGNFENKSSDVTDGKMIRPLTFNMDNQFREAIKDAFELSYLANLNGRNDGSPKSEEAKGSYTKELITKEYSQKRINSAMTISTTSKDKKRTTIKWSFVNGYGKDVGTISMTCSDSAIFGDTQSNSFCEARADAFNTAIQKTFDLSNSFLTTIFKAGDVEKGKLSSDYMEKCEVNDRTMGYYACVNASLNSIGTDFLSDVATRISAILNDKSGQSNKWKEKVLKMKDDIQAGGFLMLGSYYIRINELNDMINEALKIDTSSVKNIESATKSIRNEVYFSEGDTKVALDALKIILRTSAFSTNKEMLNRISENNSDAENENFLTKLFIAQFYGANYASTIVNSIMQGNEPISQLQFLGNSLIASVDGFTSAVAGVLAMKKVIKKRKEDIKDGLSKIFAVGGFLKMIASFVGSYSFYYIDSYMKIFGSFIDPVVTALIMGVFLIAFYLPALPAIMWVLAVMGWLILVVEAVVAAPVWAAAHAIPEGEGISGQHGRQGYLMLLNILLRPSLMVIGFFMSMALITSVSMFSLYVIQGTLISNLYQPSEDLHAIGWSFGGPFSLIMAFVSSIIIIVGTLIVVIHKALNLVTWLPENVIRWIGGQSPSLGEQSDERRVAAMIGGMGAKTNLGSKMGSKGGPPSGGGAPKGGGDGSKGGAPEGGGGGTPTGSTGGKNDTSDPEIASETTVKNNA